MNHKIKSPITDQQMLRNHSVRHAAELLDVSERMIWKLVYNRQIAFVRIGRRVLIPESAIETYLAKNTVPVHH